MRVIKKIIFILLLLPTKLLAQDRVVVVTSPLRTTSFQEMITRIGNWIFTIGIGVLPIMILIGAYVFVTGGSDPKKVVLGRRIIFYAVIGFIIIATTRGIIALLRVILGI